MYIIGISAYFHDSAAALIKDGMIIAAAEEERFTRIKHDSSFPRHAIQFLFEFAGISPNEVTAFVYYEKPFLKFDRLFETTLAFAPRGFSFFKDSFPTWLKDKLFLKQTLKKELAALKINRPNIFFSKHHLSHAASAFYPSPYKEAAVICMDGVGEWTTTSIWKANEKGIELLCEQVFPHSLGLFYSAFTGYCGFKVNSDEYKLMGLAPYGRPLYVDILKKYFVKIKNDGSILLNMDIFDFGRRSAMLDHQKSERLLGFGPRKADDPLLEVYCDLAASAQKIIEESSLLLAQTAAGLTGSKNLCLAGGVALNCVANGLIAHNEIFENIWVQPAAGDSGGSLGAALAYYYQSTGSSKAERDGDFQQGSLLGPQFSIDEIKTFLDKEGISYTSYEDESQLYEKICELLESEHIGALFQGRMEFGPRALGSRSIIADPRLDNGQKRINLSIKFRESFRPFAPVILKNDCQDYFDLKQDSPYMLMVAKLKESLRVNQDQMESALYLEKQKVINSRVPAVIHVDYSARIQTLSEDKHPFFTRLVEKFKERTGCPILVNTSFNVNGEPIVCRPEEALDCFYQTQLTFLVMENMLILKEGNS